MRTDALAICFTDIKGYTAATSNQTHQENAKMLRRIQRLVAPVVLGYNGRIVKSIGDAYMIVFRSPTEAVRAAAAVQDRLHQHNTNSAADQAIHLRIAMNFGEVRVHQRDVFGEPVNIAARIEGVTPADEIYISEAVYLTMNRSDIVTEVVGDYELKGIPEPVTVYRVKKFAHLKTGEGQEGAENDSGSAAAAGLPFGGIQLAHWKRLRWIRRLYQAMWVAAVLGIVGAGYLRYRPSSDYREYVVAAREAAQAGKPMEVLAAAGVIPIDATDEWNAVRAYRRQAVSMLIGLDQLDTAAAELAKLLTGAPRDAEALALRGVVHHRRGELKAALDDFESALSLSPELGSREDVIAGVVDGYRDTNTRQRADDLVEKVLQKNAVARLTAASADAEFGSRAARAAVAKRLEKLGEGHRVDWVPLYIEELQTTSCKARKAAIAKLAALGDARAVGALYKLAESNGCGAQYARSVAQQLVK